MSDYTIVKKEWEKLEDGMFLCKFCRTPRLNNLKSRSRKGMCILCMGELRNKKELDDSMNIFKNNQEEKKNEKKTKKNKNVCTIGKKVH